jgi:threonylcarbamoyladenosine tRNA methylthiotransferase MtaB
MMIRKTTARIGLITFGCRLNQYETQMMRERLEPAYEIVDRKADVYVINACTVTSLAERKARQAVHRLRRHEPGARILVVGCLAEAVALGLSRIDGSDLLVGNAGKTHIDATIRQLLDGADGTPPPEPSESLDAETVTGHAGHVRAFLKVQDGCDAACTFCRTTQVRGRSRSKSIAAAVSEARGLIDAGYPELVLSGINLAQYGSVDGDLPDLVAGLLAIPGLGRLRLGSINASGITDALLCVLASDPRACAHLHVPLQSGDDEVLRRMARGYTVAGYRERLTAVRRALPRATFGADVIVGFPGEDEEAFVRTCRVVRDIGFANLHVFRYSPRAGTQAVELPGRVPEGEKKARAQRLEEVGTNVQDQLFEQWVGREEHVLVETSRGGIAFGYSRGYLPVAVALEDPVQPGNEVAVRIVGIADRHLEGVRDDRTNDS